MFLFSIRKFALNFFVRILIALMLRVLCFDKINFTVDLIEFVFDFALDFAFFFREAIFFYSKENKMIFL